MIISWPDLKYTKPIPNNKLPVDHWGRLTTIAKAVHCGGCAAAGRPALQAKIASGIAFWRTNNFLDPNWWQNDFGAPMAIEKLLVVMANATTGPPLAPADAEYGITLLKRGTDPMWRPHGSGGHYTGEKGAERMVRLEQANGTTALYEGERGEERQVSPGAC